MKLHASIAIKNYLNFIKIKTNLDNEELEFNLPDKNVMYYGHVDLFLLWKVAEYFKPKKILEIGFHVGQSLGLLYEASQANITSVDINYEHLNFFNTIYKDVSFEINHMPSKNYSSSCKFDFIHIDGSIKLDDITADVNTCISNSHEDTVIAIDNCYQNSVEQVCLDKLIKNNFVPFLAGHSIMFWHKPSHDANDFLDYGLPKGIDSILTFESRDYMNNMIVKSYFMPAKLNNNFAPGARYHAWNLFTKTLKHYNI